MPNLVQARCGMIAHTAVVNTVVSAVYGSGAILDVETESSIRSRYAKPAAVLFDYEDSNNFYALARESAQPVIMSGGVIDPREPIANNLMQGGCCDLIPDIQADIMFLMDAVSNLEIPVIPYMIDPGDLVPAFTTHLY